MSYGNIEVPVGSPLHDKIRDKLREFNSMSRLKISERFEAWAKAEELFQAYVKKEEGEAARESERKNNGRQTYSQISIPYSYAMLLTAHTYWVSVFLGRNPVNQFTGRHG